MRQIMKKWADLKCDGKRRIVALRGPNGAIIRKKTLGPVEKMVHDILMMSPRGGEIFLTQGALPLHSLTSQVNHGSSINGSSANHVLIPFVRRGKRP